MGKTVFFNIYIIVDENGGYQSSIYDTVDSEERSY